MVAIHVLNSQAFEFFDFRSESNSLSRIENPVGRIRCIVRFTYSALNGIPKYSVPFSVGSSTLPPLSTAQA